MRALRVGTRASDLALRQTELVRAALAAAEPGLAVEVVTIATDGDLNPSQFHGEIDFVGAIERALLAGEIDLAVHSCKDLPEEPTPGLALAGTLERAAPQDVLLSRTTVELDSLPPGMRIGTSSLRRAHQLRRHDPRIVVVPMRGNVPTRVARLGAGAGAGDPDHLDGIVLAAAGLRRLGITHPNWTDLPPRRFVPAPGQGAIAMQLRADDLRLRELVASVTHEPTWLAIRAERSMLRALAAGCDAPVGGLAAVEGGRLTLHGQLFSRDGTRVVEERASVTGIIVEPESLGRKIAARLRLTLGEDRSCACG